MPCVYEISFKRKMPSFPIPIKMILYWAKSDRFYSETASTSLKTLEIKLLFYDREG